MGPLSLLTACCNGLYPAILRGSKTKLGQPVPEYLTSAAAWENTLRLTYALPAQTYYLSHRGVHRVP